MSVSHLAIKGCTSSQDWTLHCKGLITIIVQDSEFNIIDSFVVTAKDLKAIDYYNEDVDTLTMYQRLSEVCQ